LERCKKSVFEKLLSAILRMLYKYDGYMAKAIDLKDQSSCM